MRNMTVVLAVAAILVLTGPVFGTIFAPPSDPDSWHVDSNWSGGSIPTATDGVFVYKGYTAQITQAAYCDYLALGTSGFLGHLDMTGGSLDAANVGIGRGAAEVCLLAQSGSAGAVNVSGILAIGDYWSLGTPGMGKYAISAGSLTVVGDTHVGGPTTGVGEFAVSGGNVTSINFQGDYTQNSASTLTFEIDGTSGITEIVVDGTANLGGILTVGISGTGHAGTYTLMTYTAKSGTFDSFTKPDGWDDPVYDVNMGGGVYGLQITVPEPATMALLGIGGISVLIRRRKR